MEINPIRNDNDLTAALRRLDAIFDAEPGTPEDDELDILATLVERYEAARYPIPQASPVDVIRFVMEQNDYTQADLGRVLGSRSRASEILGNRRPLSIEHIRALVKHWHVPAAALIGATADA